MNEITLAGCTPTPLAHYLKALGVFRLLAEQKDPHIKARWHKDQFVLHTALTQAEIESFFLAEYRPTPILAPWNGGSGFFEGDNKDGFDPMAGSPAQRFGPIAQGIATAQQALQSLGLTEKPTPDNKPRLLATLRATANDDMLVWLDAAVVLTSGSPSYPPLLGTGGNDGRLDFTNNFLQRLVELFDAQTGQAVGLTGAWLVQALFGEATPRFATNAIGQFAPGHIGGANGTSGFTCDSRINPWDFILMLEGAVLFASATTRRLESNQQAGLSYPFTVYQANVGSGGMAQADAGSGKSRGEIWLPLWQNPAHIAELRKLLSEGRATVGRHAARDGLDFARAVGQLGVDRGIAAFQRYGFMVRNGLAYLATPLGRVETSRAPNTDLIADLERGRFLDALRRAARDKDAAASLKRTVSQLENALFALTQPGSSRDAIQRCLILLGETQQVLGASRKGREAVPILPHLSDAWIAQADDGSAEFRIALALAGLQNIRAYLAPVAREKAYWQWSPESRNYVWGQGDLVRNLVRVVERRVMEAGRKDEEPFAAFNKQGAELGHIQGFLAGRTDDARIAALLLGLIWADLPEIAPAPSAKMPAALLPSAYPILKSFFTPPALLTYLDRLPKGTNLHGPDEIVRLLAGGQADKAVQLAWRWGRIAGFNWPKGPAPASPHIAGPRLLAALAIPLNPKSLLQLLPRTEQQSSETV